MVSLNYLPYKLPIIVHEVWVGNIMTPPIGLGTGGYDGSKEKNNPQFVDPPSRGPQPWQPGSLAQVTAKRRAMRRLRQHALNRRTLRAQHLGLVRKYHKPMRLMGPVLFR